jgi:hypothetical protein
MRHLFVTPREGRTTHPALTLFAVTENGDLLWFHYTGNGEQDPSGRLGFDGPNQGNQIGRGFTDFDHIVGIGGGTFIAVPPSGELIHFRYTGDGELDPTGAKGFIDNNPGTVIGRGFQTMRHIFGGSTDHGGPGHLIFTVGQDGALRYFRYDGLGEPDPTGTLGFESPNQGNQIGRGF